MSFSYYNPQDRYRQRWTHRVAGFLLVVFIMGLSVLIGYFFGKERISQEGIFMQQQVKTLAAERDALQSTVTDLRTEARTATLRLEEMQKDYKDAVPQGPAGELIALINKQLAEGRDAERLAFLIRSARPPRGCKDPESQRFIVSTPAYTGAAGQASIAEGAILVKGSGSSARNDKGENEAWYDPSKPVTLEFVIKDGRAEKKQGVMPLSHSIVIDGREYRFTISEGAQSFAKVTFDSCDYP